jgi:hypothetical protein
MSYAKSSSVGSAKTAWYNRTMSDSSVITQVRNGGCIARCGAGTSAWTAKPEIFGIPGSKIAFHPLDRIVKKSAYPPISDDSTTLYQALTTNQNRRSPIFSTCSFAPRVRLPGFKALRGFVPASFSLA